MLSSAHLHLTLRSLCINTEWKYAVFWKLKRLARMLLTWEDAYYVHHEQQSPEMKCVNEALDSSSDGHYLCDPLGLEVAKMSYHVYSLGEGIVGQVAVTGQHRWIFADKHAANIGTSFEFNEGWQTQFSAGIRTVVVVAVVPHGVVQLGSLNKVNEDMKLVNHIRQVFSAPHGSSVGYVPNPKQCRMNDSSSMPDIPTSLCPEFFTVDKSVKNETSDAWPSTFRSIARVCHGPSYNVPLPSTHQERPFEVINKQIGSEISTRDDVSAKLLQPRSEGFVLGSRTQVQMKPHDDGKCEGEIILDNINLNNSFEKFGTNFANFPFDLLNSAGVLQTPEPSDVQQQKELKNKLDSQTEIRPSDSLNTSINFSAGFELHEVLGSAFLYPNMHCNWEGEKTEAGTPSEMAHKINSYQLDSDVGSDNLLEAVVGNIFQSVSEIKSKKPVCQSMQSLLTTEKEPEASSCVKHMMGPAGYSIEQPSLTEEDPKHYFSSSDACGATSPNGFSSTCPSACSERLDRSGEPVKAKKRARPGESCKPRPRDRQLIQDRIKELRELVPNGSKCSIDSLLERTIKHMLFLQNIAKYADKLKDCAESKLRKKDPNLLGSSSFEHGSSWAVEVGSHLKVCPIVVENLNMNGQLLIEMLCEECGNFLEIAEAIKGLGLTILKGATEAHGEKTRICFVVEGQNDKTMHRMDVLWSLVQILQPRTTV